MATFTWYVYTTTWTDVSTYTIVFSGDASNLATPITVGTWNSGTHLGNGDPGTDQCGATHANNVKYINSTQAEWDVSTEDLTAMLATEATLRIFFTDASSVATSSARFYAYDGTTTTAEAVGIEAYAFEQGVAATTWTQINDDSGNIGGDNTSERLTLSDQAAGTEHNFYIAVSARPETVGSKTQFDFGIALTYS